MGDDNAITTALIAGIDSDGGETFGWDLVVKANMTFNDVVRTSATVVTITLGAEPTYLITGDETITVTVPATAVAGDAIVATPTFDILAFAPVADSMIEQAKPTTNYGTDNKMLTRSWATAKNMRSLVQFDVAAIPWGSTVDSATLTLCATSVPGVTRTYDLHRVTASWVETSVTWGNQPTVAGAATASATTPGSPGCMSWTVTADVQLWVDGTTNNGWRVMDDFEDEGGKQTSDFRTREDTAVLAEQPTPDVSYTAP